MATNKQLELLRACVDELKELYESIERPMEHVRNKGLALLAGEFALVAFLFAPNPGEHFPPE